jgi:hypothetical protein
MKPDERARGGLEQLSPWRNPTQLEYPAFLLNFPFSYATRHPNNAWMQELTNAKRQPDFRRAVTQFLSLYNFLTSESLVYLLPTPRDIDLQDLVYTANRIALDHLPTKTRQSSRTSPLPGETAVGMEFFSDG